MGNHEFRGVSVLFDALEDWDDLPVGPRFMCGSAYTIERRLTASQGSAVSAARAETTASAGTPDRPLDVWRPPMLVPTGRPEHSAFKVLRLG